MKIKKTNVKRLLNVNCDGTVQFNLKVTDGEAYYLREALRKGRKIYLYLFEGKKMTRLGYAKPKKRFCQIHGSGRES